MPLEIEPATLERITKPHTVRFWGQEHLCEPVFIEEAMGDGMRLIAITPLNTRPNYYLIRVDSKWWMTGEKWRADDSRLEEFAPENDVAEHIDDICETIENQVGSRDTYDDDGNEILMEWPALNEHSGVSWCDAMDLLEVKKRGRRRA